MQARKSIKKNRTIFSGRLQFANKNVLNRDRDYQIKAPFESLPFASEIGIKYAAWDCVVALIYTRKQLKLIGCVDAVDMIIPLKTKMSKGLSIKSTRSSRVVTFLDF